MTGVPAQGTCVEDYDPTMLSAVIAELNEVIAELNEMHKG